MLDASKKLKIHNEVKKEISAVKIKDHCEVCGLEITEPPMPIGVKTVCQACFWKWMKSVKIRKEK